MQGICPPSPGRLFVATAVQARKCGNGGTGGLTSQLLLLVPLRGPNVGGQSSSCRFASPPPARAPAHFRFRTRARTAAATCHLRPCGQSLSVMPDLIGHLSPSSALRSFAIEGQLVRRCPFLVFRGRTFGKWLTIKAHPPHSERITFRYVWILLARRRSEAVPLQVRPRTVAGRAVRCNRSAKKR